MKYLAEVAQFRPESLADGLMAQADPQDGFHAGIAFDNGGHEAGFLRYAGARRENDFVVPVEFVKSEGIVSEDLGFGTKLPHQVPQVVGKRVVIVYDDGFHCVVI